MIDLPQGIGIHAHQRALLDRRRFELLFANASANHETEPAPIQN
jgi:hypothetical protein